MTFESAFFALFGFTLVRELWSMWQIQKLLNKAMSRSHHEYQVARSLGKVREEKIKVDDDMAEDLGALQGIV